jgi:Tropinone reductase 1
MYGSHAIVEELIGFGAKVHTCARNEDDLGKCLNEWNHLGFGVTGSICDVSVPRQTEVLMEDVSSVFNGKLNILVSSSFPSLIMFITIILVCVCI